MAGSFRYAIGKSFKSLVVEKREEEITNVSKTIKRKDHNKVSKDLSISSFRIITGIFSQFAA